MSIIVCEFCNHNIKELEKTGVKFCAAPRHLDGDWPAAGHYWRHVMEFLPLAVGELLPQDERWKMDLAEDMRLKLKSIQTFKEPIVTDILSRVKKVKIDSEKEYEKVVGTMGNWF